MDVTDRYALIGYAKGMLEISIIFFEIGAIASLLGFILAWFRPGERNLWWYSGLGVLQRESANWIFLLIGIYVALVFDGYYLILRSVRTANLVAFLALLFTICTLVLLGAALADAKTFTPLWHIGLIVM